MLESNLAEMSVETVSEILEDFMFFTPAKSYTFDDGSTYDYPAKYESGWQAVEKHADGDGYHTSMGLLKLVETFGGEGLGDSYWFVFSLTQGDVTRNFKRDGWWASSEGGEYEGPTTEVVPAEKTIIVWEEI